MGLWNTLSSLSTRHTRFAAHPQTYWLHAWIAIKYSTILAFGAMCGLIHGILPWLFPFTTSTIIFKSARALMMMSARHDDEVRTIFGSEFLAFIEKQRAKK